MSLTGPFAGADPDSRTVRGSLADNALDQMTTALRGIAGKLTSLPLRDGEPGGRAPPRRSSCP
jgi:hypothetical protein